MDRQTEIEMLQRKHAEEIEAREQSQAAESNKKLLDSIQNLIGTYFKRYQTLDALTALENFIEHSVDIRIRLSKTKISTDSELEE